MNAFDRLIDQIDFFIKKFYKNQMVKGIILFSGILLFTYLLVTSLEYFGRFNNIIRAFLFFSFITINVFVFVKYLIIPVLKLFSFGKRIDRDTASEIIGKFFPHISDRLKNTLQLQNDYSSNTGNIELLKASVQQRSNELSVIPFASAINIRDNKKYLKYILPLLVLFITIGLFVPSLLTQGTERVVNYDQNYVPVAPFSFHVNQGNLQVQEGENIDVVLTLKGKGLPENVYIYTTNGKFLMERTAKNEFVFTIVKPKKSDQFRFSGNEYQSSNFYYQVYGKAVVGNFQAKLVYPSYLEKESEVIENAGDLTVPEGTKIEWSVLTKNTAKSSFVFNGQTHNFTSNGFKLSKTIAEQSKIKLLLENSFNHHVDSLNFQIDVLKDAFPLIEVHEQIDSLSEGIRFFSGQIGDDYGLKKLNFYYKIIRDKKVVKEATINVKAVAGTKLPFDFAVDFKREEIQLEDKIEYFFVVYDNDGVNGSKSTRSQTFTYKLPTLEELNEKRDDQNNNARAQMSSLLEKSKEFQSNLDRLKKDMMNSKSNQWNNQNQAQNLQKQHQDLLQDIQKLQDQLQQSTEEKNQLSEIDKELLEMQNQIEELLKEVMDDEMLKLLDELQKLINEDNKQLQNQKLDELKQNSEDIKNQLDRTLEMLKKTQLNEKIDDVEKELKELAKEQEALKEAIENKKIDEKNAQLEQQKINDKFEQLKDDLKKLDELNKSLQDPMDIENALEKQESISNELNQAKESLSQNKSKKASESQQNAADEMKKMADQLNEEQQESNQQQQEEDINSLRQILESLVALSLTQEQLTDDFYKVSDLDPNYKKYSLLQKRINSDTKIVKDSLLALAKRQPKIAKFIDKELNDIAMNQRSIVNDIDEHHKRNLNIHQQYVMTAYNNLALLLNESLQSMQQQMNSMMESIGSCSKPGKGKPKPGNSMNMSDMKEMLKKQLEQMQKGPNPNGKQPGDKPGDQPGMKPGTSGQDGMGFGSKEAAKMAAEQSLIRKRLEQLRNELNKDGKGSGNKLNPLIEELKQQENQLTYKKAPQELINRQKQILTRLLESEKSIMERGFEEKRESKSGKNSTNSNQIRFDEYNLLKLRQIELLKTVDPSLNKYYRDRVNEYFNLNN